MSTLLHMSFRVNDPQRSAELYADLLDGKVVGSGPQLNSIGVRTVVFGDWQPGRLNDIMEFWPLDKHWAKGEFTDRTVGQDHHFGHIAFTTDKSFDQLAAIAAKHKVEIVEEERGPAPPRARYLRPRGQLCGVLLGKRPPADLPSVRFLTLAVKTICDLSKDCSCGFAFL